MKAGAETSVNHFLLLVKQVNTWKWHFSSCLLAAFGNHAQNLASIIPFLIMLFFQKHKSPASLINPVKSNRLWLDRQGLCLWVSPHLEKHQTPRAEHKSEAADLLVDLLLYPHP